MSALTKIQETVIRAAFPGKGWGTGSIVDFFKSLENGTGILTGSIVPRLLANNSIDGSKIASVADANPTPGVLLVHRVNIANAAGDTDLTLGYKFQITGIKAKKTTATGVGSAKTLTVKNGTHAITDAISLAVADQTEVRALTYDDAYDVIDADGTLRFTIATSGQDASCVAYVYGFRVA